jgi:hypothetical protein
MRELVCLELVVLILYILTYLCILLSFNVHEEVSMWYELKHPRSSCCLPHLSPTTLTSCGRAPTFSFPSSSLISRAQHFKRLCRECLRAVTLYLSFGWSRLQQNRPKIGFLELSFQPLLLILMSVAESTISARNTARNK